MSATQLIKVLIHETLVGDASNVAVYADGVYSKKLRLAAIEHIQFILHKIKKDQLAAQKANLTFDLTEHINSRHHDTGLTMLDYCVLAGLCDLGLTFAFYGGTTSCVTVMQQKLGLYFVGASVPQIVSDVYETIDEINQAKVSVANININSDESNGWMASARSYLSQHKVPSLLFTLGASCAVLSPFAHGAGTVLLLSVGIPSLLSSISAYQNSKGGTDNRQFAVNQSFMEHQVKEIDNLLTMVAQEKLAITTRTPMLDTQIIAYANKSITVENDYACSPLLFKQRNNVADDLTLEQQSQLRASMKYTI